MIKGSDTHYDRRFWTNETKMSELYKAKPSEARFIKAKRNRPEKDRKEYNKI